MADSSAGSGARSEGDQVEVLLERVLDLPEAARSAALDRLCEAHPGFASALRSRYLTYARLERLGTSEPGRHPGRFGEYELLHLLGQGGMGMVWQARQFRGGVERMVALKLIQPMALFSSVARSRFRREAQAAMRLDHPGLCPVYDVGEVDGTPYIAMRLVPGRSLASYLEDARREGTSLQLPGVEGGRGAATPGTTTGSRDRFEAILLFVEAAARAVHAAHESGFVHRDIKPGNLMVAPDGAPVLLDFGLTREMAEADVLTATGQMLGTLLYMAPEQATPMGREVGRAADVYALGATLFECLTLRPPFVGQTNEEVLLRVLHDRAPRARRFDPGLPTQVEAVLETALRKEPERRYPTALAFAEDLQRLRERQPIAARRTGVVLRTRLWAERNPLVAVVLVLLVAASGFAVWQTSAAVSARESSERSLGRTQRAIAELVEVARDRLNDAPGFAAERSAMLAKALEFYRELSSEPANDERTRLAWAHARIESGLLHKELGDLMRARGELEAGTSELDRHEDALRRDPALARGRAKGLRALASIVATFGDLREADALAQRAIAALGQVAAIATTPEEARSARAELLSFRASVAYRSGRWTDLEREAAALLDQTSATSAPSATEPELRAQAHEMLGAAKLRLGDTTGGLAAITLAIAGYRTCLEGRPRSRSLRSKLAGALGRHGALTVRGGATKEALSSLREAVDLAEGLTSDFPEIADYRITLVEQVIQTASLERSLGETEAARRRLLRASAVAELEQGSKRVPLHMQVALERARLERDDGNPEEMRRALRGALELFDPRAVETWGDVEPAVQLAVAATSGLPDPAQVFERVAGWCIGLERLGRAPESIAVHLDEFWLRRGELALARGFPAQAEEFMNQALRFVQDPQRRVEVEILRLEAIAGVDPLRGVRSAQEWITLVTTKSADSRPSDLALRCEGAGWRILGVAQVATGDGSAARESSTKAAASLRAAHSQDRNNLAVRVELGLVLADLAAHRVESGELAQAAQMAKESLEVLRVLAERGAATRHGRLLKQASARLTALPDEALGRNVQLIRARLQRVLQEHK